MNGLNCTVAYLNQGALGTAFSILSSIEDLTTASQDLETNFADPPRGSEWVVRMWLSHFALTINPVTLIRGSNSDCSNVRQSCEEGSE